MALEFQIIRRSSRPRKIVGESAAAQIAQYREVYVNVYRERYAQAEADGESVHMARYLAGAAGDEAAKRATGL